VFAAIVPVSFQLTELATVFRRPTRPMPMLEIHGNTDKTVRYPEGIGFGSVEDGFDDWARFNGCVGESEITWDNGNGAFRKTYQYCDNNIKVEFLVLNAGHNDIYCGEADNVDVTRIIWDFLSQWTMP
jgi:poly(3-hydroxybutyrate) depolymerase